MFLVAPLRDRRPSVGPARPQILEVIGVIALPPTIVAAFIDTRGFDFVLHPRADAPLIWHMTAGLVTAIAFAVHFLWRRRRVSDDLHGVDRDPRPRRSRHSGCSRSSRPVCSPARWSTEREARARRRRRRGRARLGGAVAGRDAPGIGRQLLLRGRRDRRSDEARRRRGRPDHVHRPPGGRTRRTPSTSTSSTSTPADLLIGQTYTTPALDHAGKLQPVLPSARSARPPHAADRPGRGVATPKPTPRAARPPRRARAAPAAVPSRRVARRRPLVRRPRRPSPTLAPGRGRHRAARLPRAPLTPDPDSLEALTGVRRSNEVPWTRAVWWLLIASGPDRRRRRVRLSAERVLASGTVAAQRPSRTPGPTHRSARRPRCRRADASCRPPAGRRGSGATRSS